MSWQVSALASYSHLRGGGHELAQLQIPAAALLAGLLAVPAAVHTQVAARLLKLYDPRAETSVL